MNFFDLTQILPLIRSMTEKERQRTKAMWERTLSDWRKDLKDAELSGNNENFYLDKIQECLFIIKLLDEY